MSNKSLAPINDINLKIFDEICEERFSALDLDVLMVSIIDNLPSDALPHLAEQYHITGNEGWLQARNDFEKRDLIKRSIEVHRYKGTKYALKRIFDMFGLEGKIQEWFETGGEPFTFTVDLDFVSKGLDLDLISKLEDLINEYKNVRSHLASLKISMPTKVSNYKYKIATICGECTTIYPFIKDLIFGYEMSEGDENEFSITERMSGIPKGYSESNWNETYWSMPEDETLKLEIAKWDEGLFDESLWAFG